MSNIITPGVGRAGTSQKITVTIFSTESKKLWLVSHKSRVFVFQKYFGQPPFWTFIGHVAYMLRKWQHFHQCPKMGVCTEWVDGVGWMNQDLNQKYSNFKRNIFGRKVCFTCFPIIQTGTFIIFKKTKFWTEYFRLKSVFSYVFLLSRQGLLWKYTDSKYSNFKRNIFGWKVSFRMNSYGSNRDFYEKKHKPNQWIIHIPVRLFRSNSKYNIARYYIKHYSTREWPSWVFWP